LIIDEIACEIAVAENRMEKNYLKIAFRQKHITSTFVEYRALKIGAKVIISLKLFG